jgi:hypothetical protein
MNKLLLVWCFALSSLFAFSQNGNEWIDYSQQYLSFKIYQTGWYRLDYTDVQPAFSNIGIDVSTISSDQLQVFGRETEQPIVVQDGGDGTFDSGDYIEFYAEKNDGWKDSILFDDPETEMSDAYFSYVNDTITYYLSVSALPDGKRFEPETDVNVASYPFADYCWVSNYFKQTNNYALGPLFYGQSSPAYGEGEGWIGKEFTNSTVGSQNRASMDVRTVNYYTGSNPPNAIIKAQVFSASDPNVIGSTENHSYTLRYNSNGGWVNLADSSFSGYKLVKSTFEVDGSTMNSPNTRVQYLAVDIGQGGDERLFASSATIIYPHTMDFEGSNNFPFALANSTSGSKQSLSISNISGSNPRLFVLNDATCKELPLTLNAGQYEVVVPNNTSNDSIQLLLIDTDNYSVINSLNPVGATGAFVDYSAISPTDAYVIITHESLLSASTDFGNYRASAAGGLHDVVVVDVQELYHQFGGGIDKHPVAIRNFMKFGTETWPTAPGHLFLIGKSISNHANDGGSRESTASFAKNLVPTWGYPGSDNHLTQGVDNSGKSYGVATGRLTTTSAQEVLEYLDKVIEYEVEQDPLSLYDIPNKEWQKNVLLLGGGDDALTNNVISAYFDVFENKLSDTALGAVPYKYFRDPFATSLDLNTYYSVQNHLLEGVSLINFYGHSSAGTGFSLNIDDPENWDNAGKYPVVIGLGCYTGDVHNFDDNVYAIDLVNIPNEGAICLMSTVTQGFLTNIGYYTEIFYSQMANLNYGESIGEHMKSACDSIYSLQGTTVWSITSESNYTGMSLQGDPSLKLNVHQYPELVLDENRVWTVPAQIDLSVDTFELYVVSTNIGRAFIGDHDMIVERIGPNGIDTTIVRTLNSSYNRDTIIFHIPTNHAQNSGLNYFNISVDLPTSQIVEQQDELTNNQITYSTYINSNGLQPIWPYEYGIIPYDTVTLKASTLDPFEQERNYIIEIDVDRNFNTAFKKYQTFTSVGGVIEAHPGNWINTSGGLDSLVFTDSTVYYWRCSVDSVEKNWLESSFQYIPGIWGWGQADFQQFEEDYFQGIDYDTLNEQFNFGANFATVHISMNTNVGNWSTSSYQNTSISLNGNNLDYGGPDGDPAILIAVIDPCTLEHWETPHLDYDGIIHNQENCFGQFNGDPDLCAGTSLMGRDREHGFFAFRYEDSEEMDSLATFLENKIPDGFYVAAYTFIPDAYTVPSSLYGAMPPALITAFQNLGATNISNSQPDDGWILFAQKGLPANTIELHTTDTIASGVSMTPQSLNVYDTIQGCQVGYIVSEVVGPAFEWNELHWEQSDFEPLNADSTRLRVYGMTFNQSSVLLIDTLMTDLDSILQLDQLIDANTYPLLQLEAEYHDTVALTPAQIKRWQVIYAPVPELALNPKKGYYFKSSEYQEGDSVELSIAIENVSHFDMDSLLVEYWNLTSFGNRTLMDYPKQDSLRKYEVLRDTVRYPTNGLTGVNYAWIIANPYVSSNIQDQREQFYFNNIAERSFTMTHDEVNPILDVTFDGVHIINEDIVSAEPNILITLDDENPYLLMDEIEDTSLFKIYLRHPDQSSFERIYFMDGPNEVLHFEPAQDAQNKFSIEYNPMFVEDGIYTLQVQGSDKSNNASGDYSYEIDFEVITHSSITHLFNYPNPFSTSTQFVFTLTGSEIPDEMQIQIMTITGKVVKEIDLYELGDIRIGNNITSYAWDGRDEYGDQLANGIYLYRVIAKINGEDIDHRATSADENAFHKGFGKMYLMR